MGYKNIFLGITLFLFSIYLCGCFSSRPSDERVFTKTDEALVSFQKYILRPADEIEIHCINVPELHLQKQRIRPDGKVSFEGIGEVEAAGKTPEELANLLYEKAIVLYSLTGEKAIDVRIEVYKSSYFYVLGEVYFEGPKVCTGRDTVFTAIAAARLTTLAWKKRIQVIRPSTDKSIRPRIFEVNWDKMAAHGDLSKNVLLQEGDVIYVPPTVLAGAGLVIEEFIRPIGRAFSTVNIVEGPPTTK